MKNIFFILLLSSTSMLAQRSNKVIYNYIEKLGLTAINTMHDSKIPASIIMAIAIEESAAGTSEVAKNANNHFGLKAGANWKGATYRTKGKSLFRKYENDKASYEAFAKVLQDNKKQYGFLFQYDKKDYKNWAKGLARSGYTSTGDTYAKKLIEIIETHELYNFDNCIWEFK
jgi:flagellum-specific peptidoglycan hydrolase FlgJ